MAEYNDEKMEAKTSDTTGQESPRYDPERTQDVLHPAGEGKPWMYKKIFGKLPYYASPQFQIVYVACACFLCPGMFNALNGLGAGGLVNAHDINRTNTALYACFAVVGFFAGSIANKIGYQAAFAFGGMGYPIYSAAVLCYNHTENAGFLIFSGAWLGICAGMFWCAQGAIMMAYPPEGQKGRYISVFWMIFNLGGVIGALIPLGQNIHSTKNSVGDGTYAAFIALMACGWALTFGLCNPKFVRHYNGNKIVMMKNPTWQSEFLGMINVLKTDWYIVLLFPYFISSNWFYTYHFQDFNLAKFNIRTRSLNNVLYWMAQIVGAAIFGVSLDQPRFRRSIRARACLVVLFIITMAIWGGGYAFQRTYTREEVTADDYVKLDWTSSGYIGPMFLYIFYGFFDSIWQTSAYWFMGSLSNNSRKLANFAAFYKGIQSAGAFISPSIDANTPSYMSEFATNWGLLSVSLLIAAPVIWLKVKDTTALETDLQFTDETQEDVLTMQRENLTGQAAPGPAGMMGEKVLGNGGTR